MPTAPSFSDAVSVGQAEAQARRSELRFLEGDYSLALLHGAAAMSDMDIRFHAQAFKETFLDGAEGDALTALADDRYNIQRTEATFAQVTARFARISSGAGGTIFAGTRIATEFDAQGNSVNYTTDTDVIVGAGNNGPFDVTATASVAGSDGNIAASTLTLILDTLFDTFTVTNPAVAAGGNDEESDPDLRQRCREFFSTLRRGTRAALEFGAKQVDSVVNARCVEDELSGLVTVFVSDEDGNSNVQMINDVITELENWRAAGINVEVTGGSQLVVDMAISLVVREGFTVASRSAEFIAAVESRMSRQRAGETFYLDMVIGALFAVAPDDLYDVVFDSITVGGVDADIEDVVPTTTQVIRPGTITVDEA